MHDVIVYQTTKQWCLNPVKLDNLYAGIILVVIIIISAKINKKANKNYFIIYRILIVLVLGYYI